jgi:hypothetical protein
LNHSTASGRFGVSSLPAAGLLGGQLSCGGSGESAPRIGSDTAKRVPQAS